MEHEELKNVLETYKGNNLKAICGLHMHENDAHTVAIISTVIDCLRGDIEGVQSPLSQLAQSSSVKTPTRGGDPNKRATECMKRLGELGVQNLDEIKGYKYDSSNHVLLFVNNRFADTGWEKGDEHIYSFVTIVKDMGLAIPHMD